MLSASSTTALTADPGLAGHQAQASHLRAMLDGMTLGLLTFDGDLDILFANRQLAAILEVEPTILAGAATLLDLLDASPILDEAAVQGVHEACLGAIATGTARRWKWALPAARARRCFTLQVVPLAGDRWMICFEEVTASQEAEASAIELARRDPLTGLASRQLFHEHAGAALASLASQAAGTDQGVQEAVGHAVLLVDLDRFKAVNDTLGHAVGDGLLRLVSKRLHALLRQQDMVARLGGDEFALMVTPAPGVAGLSQLAKRLIDVLSRPYLVDGHLVNIGASVGIAVAPQDGRDCDELLRNADLALYASKDAGRSRHSFFDPSMDARARARRSLEIDLRKALALREFELHYQPQINLETNAVVGFEALLRWRHPDRGLVSPLDFIPLSEEIGLIVPLGEWVLREACREAARWPDSVSVAVNVSPCQFEDPDRLTRMVAASLAATGLPGKRLEIEITESVLLRNEDSVRRSLHQLRAMDVRVAMDDFGTGYSSLSQLNSFPFDKIKIDRCFVHSCGDTGSQDAIIRAITALGASLGMATIAEGVETPDQLLRIRAEGCTSVQGFLFSRPVPLDQVDALIAAFPGRRSD